MQKGIVSVTLLTTAVLLGGCSLVGPEACTDDLTWRVSPDEVELALGQSTTVQAEAFGCGGKEPLEEDMRWTSADQEVATVDLTTGRVTAMGTGATAITGEDEGPYGIGPVEIPVTVAP